MSARARSLGLAVMLMSSTIRVAELSAQAVSARAVLLLPRTSLRDGGLTDHADGVWGGGAFDVSAGPITLSGSGARGQLSPTSTSSELPREAGEIMFGARFRLSSSAGFDAGYTTRAFSSAAGHQRWHLFALGAHVSQQLGSPSVRALAQLAYLPVVEVSDAPSSAFGLRGEVGISVAPAGFPLLFMLNYRIERFSDRIERFGFPSATARSEQFEALSISAGVQIRRKNGLWRVGN